MNDTNSVLSRSVSQIRHSTYTVFQKNPYDYVFDDNLNNRRPIVIIFGTVIT